MTYTDMNYYFSQEAQNEFQEEVDEILKTIYSNSKYELSEIPKIIFSWDITSNTMNASAKKIGYDSYQITVNSFTPWHLKRELLWDKINTENINASKYEIVHSFISHILSFIIWHEYYHIAFGHCTIPRYCGELNENISVAKGSFKQQQLEVMCDLAAARKFASDVFVIYDVKKEREVFAWLFAYIYIYFLEQEQIKANSHNAISVEEIICDNRTHPFPTVRYNYVLKILANEMQHHCNMSQSEIAKVFIDSDVILNEMNCLDKDLLSITNDKRIHEYINKLCTIEFNKLLVDTKKIYIK